MYNLTVIIKVRRRCR